jgi:hypothetical protein
VSSAESTRTSFPYAGWVPTANGRLSFRHIGESRNPTEAFYANVATKKHRVVLAFQRRNLSDVLFQSIIHYFCNIEDRFYFSVAATSEGDPAYSDQIIGRIYIYKSKDDWKVKGRSAIAARIKNINDCRLSIASDRDQLIELEFLAARTALDATSDIHVDFELQRTGEIFVSSPRFLDQDLEYASTEYAVELDQDFAKWIADQCYFFLRDIAHRHQHHDPSSDTILILQKRDKEGVEWRRNVVFSLHHYIIRSKRFADARTLHQAAGILAYCNSFLKICERALGNDIEKIPRFNEEALTQSLNARAITHDH